jgi:hypothetical protein
MRGAWTLDQDFFWWRPIRSDEDIKGLDLRAAPYGFAGDGRVYLLQDADLDSFDAGDVATMLPDVAS